MYQKFMFTSLIIFTFINCIFGLYINIYNLYKISNQDKNYHMIEKYSNHIENDPQKDTIIYAELTNMLDSDMTFLYCNITTGNITTTLNSIIPINGIEKYQMSTLPPNILMTSGTCTYFVELERNDKIIKLEIEMIYFKSLKTGHEFYGLTANQMYYKVHIKIVKPGIVEYFLWSI